MLEKMLASLLKMLNDMPDMDFSEKYLAEFLNRTSLITENTCFEEYEAKFPYSSDDIFWLYHRTKIRNYLTYWPQLAMSLMDLINTINFAWCHLYQSPIGADNLIPLLIKLLPNEKDLLKKVKPKLFLASAVNKDQHSTYYFYSIISAIDAKLESSPDNPEEAPDETSQLCDAVIKCMSDVKYSCPILLIVVINNFCKVKMMQIAMEIYEVLNEMKLNDYDFMKMSNTHELLENYRMMIKRMDTKIKEDPIRSNEKLVNLIYKFGVCEIFMSTLNDNQLSPSLKLIKLQKKFRRHSVMISKDFDEAKYRLTEVLCQYLNVPWENDPLITLFQPQPRKYSLTEIFAALERKDNAFDASVENKHEALML